MISVVLTLTFFLKTKTQTDASWPETYSDIKSDLLRITEKWEFDKRNMEIETQLMKHRQELEIAKFRQKIELAKIGGLSEPNLQELAAEDADDDDEGNTNNNAQVGLTEPITVLQ